jgi:hypothetical protein
VREAHNHALLGLATGAQNASGPPPGPPPRDRPLISVSWPAAYAARTSLSAATVFRSAP